MPMTCPVRSGQVRSGHVSEGVSVRLNGTHRFGRVPGAGPGAGGPPLTRASVAVQTPAGTQGQGQVITKVRDRL